MQRLLFIQSRNGHGKQVNHALHVGLARENPVEFLVSFFGVHNAGAIDVVGWTNVV
jgi:hypothetical protein